VGRLRRQVTDFLINVGVATEGFDMPSAAVVAIARPTKSESLYLQMIGRGTRPLPGVVDGPETADERRAAIAASDKQVCVVLDFVGNSGKHKLISVVDVLAGNDVDPIDLHEALTIAKLESEPQDMEELLEKAKQAREEKEKRREEARQKRLSTKHKADRADYTATDVDLFNGSSFDPFTDYTPEPDGATAKQVNYLMKLGVNAETATGYSKRQAGTVITQMKNRTGGDYIVTFGKHKGQQLKNIPRGYVDWLVKNTDRGDIHENVNIMRSESSEQVTVPPDLELPF
jgi:superfamily II DNA/RNA helicase